MDGRGHFAVIGELSNAVAIGAGATFATDLWSIVRKRFFGIPLPDWGLVGRWLAYLPRGRFRHEPIAKSPRIRGERAIGWMAHYATGVVFAAALLFLWGLDWARQPTIGPALIVGIATVTAPFLLMQPGMGAGFAASRTRNPTKSRLQSLLTHFIFGLGLYAAAWMTRPMIAG